MATKKKSKSRSAASKRPTKSRAAKLPPKKRAVTLRDQLERAAADLYHSSESDYPFKFFLLPSEGENDLTPEGFLVRLGFSTQFTEGHSVPTEELVGERSLDEFFPDAQRLAAFYGVEENDPQVVSDLKRWENLKAVLRKNLRGVKVLRVGTVEIRCYVAGLTPQGDIAGLVTTAIET